MWPQNVPQRPGRINAPQRKMFYYKTWAHQNKNHVLCFMEHELCGYVRI